MDLLLAVYHDISFFMELDYEDCWRIIEKAEERFRDQRRWSAWVTWYPHMSEEGRCSFEEFKKINKPQISNRPSEDIMNDFKRVNEKFFNKPKK